MKKRAVRWIAVLVVLALAIAPMTAFAAEPRASAYIDTTTVGIERVSNGVKVGFTIAATGTMSNVGVTTIQIYTAGGDFAKGFYYSTTSGMMGYNRVFYGNSITWTGADSGTRYYAVVTFKASNSSGSDTHTMITGYA
ncbi:MAG: hypothetical protein IJ390_11990 [Lachnospiraceae bacterium]|nr:hypothetical protein [Lachnospiraceae bacterium]